MAERFVLNKEGELLATIEEDENSKTTTVMDWRGKEAFKIEERKDIHGKTFTKAVDPLSGYGNESYE
ncbi:MAG: hypothetical protein HYV90_01935 [Candidatus Woesebacteria bacterium]|nr:MAG: hypothetical protein HYV90_01935 [Candidatus Woesebacteria bacterium]